MLQGRAVHVFWDFENQRVPNKGNLFKTLDDIRTCVSDMGASCVLSITTLVSTAESSKHADSLRNACDVVTVNAGPQAVDMRLKMLVPKLITHMAIMGVDSSRLGVCIVSGDGGYIDSLQTLKNYGITCGVLYHNSSALSQQLSLSCDFARRLPLEDAACEAGATSDGEGSETVGVPANYARFMQAVNIARGEAKTASLAVAGAVYARIKETQDPTFQSARRALIDLKLIGARPDSPHHIDVL